MRVFIQKLAGVHLGTQGELLERGFRSLGIDCVEFLADDDLMDVQREDLVIGTRLVMAKRLSSLGILSTLSAYPEPLIPLMGSDVRIVDAKELRTQDLPLFLRPVDGVTFEPVCAYDLEDLACAGVTGAAWASEVMWFQVTYRLFMRYGKRVALLAAEGDPNLVPDEDVVADAIARWADMPCACALDFGVTEDGQTVFVCARDALTAAPLGIDARRYALTVSARWAELAGVMDPLRTVACSGR